MKRCIPMLTAAVLLGVGWWGAAQGGTSEGAAGNEAAELAKKLQNPVADLISVPIQNNWDFGLGRKTPCATRATSSRSSRFR